MYQFLKKFRKKNRRNFSFFAEKISIMPKPAYYDQSRREFWRITNISKKILNIGDLPKLPTLEPNEFCDLLRYYTKEEINQSENLPYLIKKRWLRASKDLDNVSTAVSRRSPEPYLTTTETNEVEDIEEDLREAILVLASFIATGIETITKDATAGARQILLVDATSKDITITLPAASSSTNRTYYIKKIDTSSNDVIIDGTGDDEIDGNATACISVANTTLKIVSNGTAWWII